MRDFVNRKSKLLQPSGIRKFFDIVRETEGAISLGVGEPDFVTPWPIRSAAIASLQRGYTQYTANRGMRPLLELIARYLEARFLCRSIPRTFSSQSAPAKPSISRCAPAWSRATKFSCPTPLTFPTRPAWRCPTACP